MHWHVIFNLESKFILLNWAKLKERKWTNFVRHNAFIVFLYLGLIFANRINKFMRRGRQVQRKNTCYVNFLTQRPSFEARCAPKVFSSTINNSQLGLTEPETSECQRSRNLPREKAAAINLSVWKGRRNLNKSALWLCTLRWWMYDFIYIIYYATLQPTL